MTDSSALLVATYKGKADGHPAGTGRFDVHCVLCDNQINDRELITTVPGVVATAQDHARRAHDIAGASVALQGADVAITEALSRRKTN